MLTATLAANEQVLFSLNKVFSLAQKNNKQGLCNFIADRIDTHEKHGWQIRASLKG
jgi:DNA-binding ferritin-like protein